MASKLTKCKTCGKEVSSTTKTCPHCGEKSPVPLLKGCIIGCTRVIVLFVIMGLIAGPIMGDTGNKTSNQQNQPAQEKTSIQKDFPFTLDELVDRYNQVFISLSKDIIVSMSDEKDNGDQIITQLKFNTENLGAVLSWPIIKQGLSDLSFS